MLVGPDPHRMLVLAQQHRQRRRTSLTPQRMLVCPRGAAHLYNRGQVKANRRAKVRAPLHKVAPKGRDSMVVTVSPQGLVEPELVVLVEDLSRVDITSRAVLKVTLDIRRVVMSPISTAINQGNSKVTGSEGAQIDNHLCSAY